MISATALLVLVACSPSPSGGAASGLPGWTTAAAMTESRSNHAATLLADGRVLVTGGADQHDVRWSDEIYDPAEATWESVQPMGDMRAGHAAVLLPDDHVLVAGGWQWWGLIQALSSVELYDPARNAWELAQPMADARTGHSATVLGDGRVVVTGGYGSRHANPDTIYSSTEVYEPSAGSWTTLGSLSQARYGHTATLLSDGRVLVCGGRTARDILASVEIFNPTDGTWTNVAEMEQARYGHTATLLGDGTVLVTGGALLSRRLASVELYDPALNAWTTLSPMAQPRTAHRATVLADGLVLINGGNDGPNGGLAATELFEVEHRTWTVATPMTFPRGAHTATLLDDGIVLVAGGINEASNATATVELSGPWP